MLHLSRFECAEFDDDLVETLAQRWPDLQVLVLAFHVNLSVKLLVSAARYCRRTDHLELVTGGDMNILQLAEEPADVIFPCPTRLALLKSFSGHGAPAGQDKTIRMFDHRFPMLSDLYIYARHAPLLAHLSKSRPKRRRTPDSSTLLMRQLIAPVPGSRFNPISR